MVVNASDMKALPTFADDTQLLQGQVRPTSRRSRPRAELGPPACPSGISPNRRRRGRSGSCRSTASVCTASGMSADRWAYASALIDGFSDYIMITIDVSDPTKPREAGRFWLPGMNRAAGETPQLAARIWPLRTPPPDRAWRYRLLQLARRMPRRGRCRRSEPTQAHHAQNWAPPFRRRNAQRPSSARPRSLGRGRRSRPRSSGRRRQANLDFRYSREEQSDQHIDVSHRRSTPTTRAIRGISAPTIFMKTGPAASSARS